MYLIRKEKNIRVAVYGYYWELGSSAPWRLISLEKNGQKQKKQDEMGICHCFQGQSRPHL